MHFTKSPQPEIAELFEQLLNHRDFSSVEPCINYLNRFTIKSDDILELIDLIDKEIAYLTESLNSEVTINDKYLNNFIYRYQLDYNKFSNGKLLVNCLNNLKINLDEEYLDRLRIETEIEDLIKSSHPQKVLTEKQIGLLYYYISTNGGKYIQPDWYKIAKEHNHISKTSGIKIYQHFNKFHKKINRINYPTASENIRKIIDYLSDFPNSKSMAMAELIEAEDQYKKRIPKKS